MPQVPGEISILRAASEHLAVILQLLSTQLREHHIEISDTRLESAVRGVIENPGRGLILVAFLDGRCAGVAYASFVWTLEHGGCSAWLEELYVAPGLRNAGIGTTLLRAVMDECKSFGCAALDVEIDADHENVRTLYERHDFVALSRRRMVRLLKDEQPLDSGTSSLLAADSR
jgi:GNAT superfamily N-acetyltransferase